MFVLPTGTRDRRVYGPIDTYPVTIKDETVVRQTEELTEKGLGELEPQRCRSGDFPRWQFVLEYDFYQGKPHGYQKRNFPDGTLALEVFIGILSGPRPSGMGKSARKSIGVMGNSRVADFGMPKAG